MLLELDDVQVKYGAVVALKGISLSVEQGEIVTLLGANGAGKTTTLRTISGLLRPSHGQVRFEGKPIGKVPAHEIVSLGIGHVPEGRRVFPMMSVTENLEMGAYQRKGGNKKVMEHVFDLFPVLGQRKSQDGGTLSGGEQQMLAIGRALMSQPKVLLLDEPSMGLAPLIVAKIFEIIKTVNDEGTTVLLVEQNAAQALKLAARGYVLETGSIVMSDNADTLLTDDRVRAAYLGEEIGAA
ncbi:MAG: ABC transporter ATP-binding protein [Mycobacteriales bacterium]|nr:ABC transporter ATP-binding protein [Mycobacteriales bacterium]